MYDKDTLTTDLVTNSFVLMIISLCHLYHNNIVSYMYVKSDKFIREGTGDKPSLVGHMINLIMNLY